MPCGDVRPFLAGAGRRALLGVALAAGGLFGQTPTPSRVAAPPAPPSKQEEEVVGHLNATLGWYREVQGSEAWVMQPSDVFYRDNQKDLTSQVLVNAFDYARSMVVLVGNRPAPATASGTQDSRKLRLATRVSSNEEQEADLKAQQTALSARISAAAVADRPALVAQEQVLQARINLDMALGETLEKSIALFSDSNESSDGASLSSRIAALQVSVPEVFDSHGTAQTKKAAPSAAPPPPSDGLVNRAAQLFSLVRYQRSLDSLLKRTNELQAAANALAQPLAAQLRAALKAGDDDSQQTAETIDPAQLAQLRDKIDNTAARFRNLSAALLPLREEALALDHTRANLSEWKASIVAQTDVILRVLFTRAIGLLIALGVLFAISEGWKRATFRYVHDSRRRRQFLLIRRFATSTLMVVVIVMGFVSDFSSLATFAGFITAGIAVALQTVILSVAAYFFLIGRYGVRVGDRVTVSGVTGDVIDIGLVRVFLMELAGTGVDLHPTGRVVVLANSALFSTSPVFKQLPGTDYAWHEIFVVLAADSDPGRAPEVLLAAVNKVYGGYRTSIEQQHGALERLLDYKTDIPVPSAQVRLSDAGLEVVVRYPAEIRRMSEIDQAVTKDVLEVIRADAELRKALTAMPRIRSAVKS